MPFYDYPLIRSRIDDCVYCSTRRFRRASTNEPNFYNPSDFVDRLAVSTPTPGDPTVPEGGVSWANSSHCMFRSILDETNLLLTEPTPGRAAPDCLVLCEKESGLAMPVPSGMTLETVNPNRRMGYNGTVFATVTRKIADFTARHGITVTASAHFDTRTRTRNLRWYSSLYELIQSAVLEETHSTKQALETIETLDIDAMVNAIADARDDSLRQSPIPDGTDELMRYIKHEVWRLEKEKRQRARAEREMQDGASGEDADDDSGADSDGTASDGADGDA